MDFFDIAILGAGVSGVFSLYEISKNYPDCKTLIIDMGRPPMKRKHQTCGWLGCMPGSDGKLFLSNLDKLSNIVGTRKTKTNFKIAKDILSNVADLKITKDALPKKNILNKLKKIDYSVSINDYIQLYPKQIHAFSKFVSDKLEKNKNITFSFDNEIFKIEKCKNYFTIYTEFQEYKSKKIILNMGRSGWRWVAELYKSYGLIENNDIAQFGVKIEINSNYMKDFNNSACNIYKTDNSIEIGPLSWNGTVIPEDHMDTAISAFRSNEDRWSSDKVSFNFIKNYYIKDNGFEQVDRLSKLIFVLTNDRVLKEKTSSIFSKSSVISVLEKEFAWLGESLSEFSAVIPELLNKSYFYIPTAITLPPKINIGSNLSTDIPDLFVGGESAGLQGILSAMCCGTLIANEICK